MLPSGNEHESDEDARAGNGTPKRAMAVDEDEAARHGEHAVREVDEPHQAHRHRQAHGDHVQDHAVSDAVEGDAYDR